MTRNHRGLSRRGVSAALACLALWGSHFHRRDQATRLHLRRLHRVQVSMGPPHFILFSAGGQVLTYFKEDGGMAFLDVATGKRLSALRTEGEVSTVRFSTDGTTAVWLAPRVDGNVSREFVVASTATGRELTRIVVDDPDVSGWGLSPDGSILRAVSEGPNQEGGPGEHHVLHEWDTRRAREEFRQTLRFPVKVKESVGYSPDLTRAVGWPVGSDEEVVWDLRSGQRLFSTPPPMKGVGPARRISFSPDGRALQVGRSNGTLELWDIDACRLAQAVRFFAEHEDALPTTMDDRGRTAVVYGGEIRPRNPLGFLLERLGTILLGLGTPIQPLPYAPVLWDVPTGRELKRFSKGTLADLSPDGRLLASSDGHSITIWELSRVGGEE